MRDILSDLNPEQRRAVTYTGGPLKIVAGAGTGKTGTLTRRFAYLAEQGTPADRILALTFSRRAAGEFRERALELLDHSYTRLWISTFHGFCLRVLRAEKETVGGFRVIGEAEQRRVIGRAVRDDPEAGARTYYVGESGAARLVQDAVTLISRTKDEGIGVAEFAEYADRRDVARLQELANLYIAYEKVCRDTGRVDFGDLCFLLVDAFRRNEDLLRRWRERFDHVLIDEFQDTNESQWQLITLLAPPPGGNLTVVGDSAQAIYAFRGASSRFFERFTEEYAGAESITLTANYRSRQPILDVAHALIHCNACGDAHLQADGGEIGQPVRIAGFADEDAEADHIARTILRLTAQEGLGYTDCAVLCRSVRQAASPLARAFTAYGIPFHVRGYDPAVEEAVDDLRAMLRCISGSATWIDAARVLVRRHVAMAKRLEGVPEDALARRYAELLGPNQEVLGAVPPISALVYGQITDWMDGSETWRSLEEVRAALRYVARESTRGRSHVDAKAVAYEALTRLEEACRWLRGQTLEGQVYAALALVGRLDADSPTTVEARAGVSACRRALRAAHGLARAGLGIPELLAELDRLTEEETELGDPKSGPGVPIVTLHASKGLQWRAVFVACAAAGILPAPLRLDRAFDLDDLAEFVRAGRNRSVAEVAAGYEEEPERQRAARFLCEERRLAYVGCTRAREQLYVTYAQSYDGREAQPSPFIAEMQQANDGTWVVDGDARVLLPLDVARATRQQALAALGVAPSPSSPTAPRPGPPAPALKGKGGMSATSPDPGFLPSTLEGEGPGVGGADVLAPVLTAQWTAALVAGGVPIRFRELPRPFVEESLLSLSFTGIDAYRACPRQFFYGHVLHVDRATRGTSVTLGTRVHSALLTLNTLWMETGRPPEDAEVQDAWRSVWPIDGDTVRMALENPETRVRWDGGFIFARQVVQAWQRGGKYLRRYYKWERDRFPGTERRPVALEKPFEFERGGHRIDGRIDCVMRSNAGDVVLDYKTGKPKSALKPEKSLQLAIYERAWEMESGGTPAVAYYFLGNDEDKADTVVSWDSGKQVKGMRYTDSVRDALWAEISSVLEQVKGNHFAAEPAEGKSTCAVCAYNLWCEESLA